MSDDGGGRRSYTLHYDAIGQLTSFTRSDGQSESYAYDAVGNMLTKTKNGVQTAMRYNAANQLVQSVSGTETTAYSYDANGNLVKSENAAGARSYAYNALNLLEKFTREDGYSESYGYNAQRLLATVTTSEELTTSLTWDILYGDGVVIGAAQNGENTRFVYGLERISAISGSSRTEYVYDGRGSVAAELIYNGKELAEVASKTYSPFGEQIGEESSGFGYNGEYYNAATGMIYLRARFYAPEMNRFGQKDRQIFVVNEYEYCHNNPVLYIDSNGMEAIVISGGDYDDRGEDNGEKPGSYNFIVTALCDLQMIKEAGLDDNITWIIFDAGWTEEDKQRFDDEALKLIGEKPKYISSVEQLSQYINEKSIKGEKPEGERMDDLITHISIISHGRPGNIPLAFNYVDPDTKIKDSIISTENLDWEKSAFVESQPQVLCPTIRIYSCNGATETDGISFGEKIAETTGATVFAYWGKSSFKNIVLTTNEKIKEKLSGVDYFKITGWNSLKEKAKSFWEDLSNGKIRASSYLPQKGRGTKAVKIKPNGKKEIISEIPTPLEIAKNNTTKNSVFGKLKDKKVSISFDHVASFDMISNVVW